MATLTALSIATDQLLFENVNLQIKAGDRIGLIGKNGAGKSTLLNVLSQSESYYTITSGSVKIPDNILHIHQERLSWSNLFFDFAEESDIVSMTVIDAIESIVDIDEDLVVEDRWRDFTIKTSRKLGWDMEVYKKRAIKDLSPGSALRAYILIALLRDDIGMYLFDEPTNHLDIATKIWLEGALKKSDKMFVIVSHDGYFLNNVCTRVWEIDHFRKNIIATNSKYFDYLEQKKARLEQSKKEYSKSKKREEGLTKASERLKKISKRGEKFKGTDRDRFLRGHKRERASKCGKRAKAIERVRDSKDVVDEEEEYSVIPFEIDVSESDPIVLTDVVLKYGINKKPISLRIDFGERICIVGPNGAGKTTLLKTLIGVLEPEKGIVNTSRSKFGYLAQEYSSLVDRFSEKNPEEFIILNAPVDDYMVARSALIRHGLTLYQTQHSIHDMNSGAKIRMVFCAFSFLKVNVLVIDEPTNHLDRECVMALSDTLREFKGTVIMVSHNCEFIENISIEHLFVFDEGALRIVDSLDDYTKGLFI
jgi:ATPase subunit of ABC transporter with duplicated ATPase domains